MTGHQRYLETNCPKLSQDCDAAVMSSPVIHEADVWEAYCMGYQEAEAKDLRVLRASTIFALLFGLACGMWGLLIGRYL